MGDNVLREVQKRRDWRNSHDFRCLKERITTPHCDQPALPWPEDYDVSFVTGYVFEDPLTTLPPYFEQWNELGRSLPELIEHHTLREFVHQMAELDHKKLEGSREHWLAYVIISTATGAYVWLERDEGVTKVLPRQLAVPLCGICEHLRVPPIGIFASICTANWQFIDPNGVMDYNNMDAIVGMYPRQCFRGFLNVHIMVEQAFADALPSVMEAFDATRKQDEELLLTCLKKVSVVGQEMIKQINKMHVECDPWELFYHIRHLLAGWYFDNCPLPDGLIYEGVSEKPKKLMGGSGSQSSTFQTLEILLSVDHNPESKKLIEKMRNHMPAKHAEFLWKLTKLPSVKTFVMSSDNEDLKQTYNKCLQKLSGFKSAHMRIVAKYISAMKPKKDNRDRQYSDDKGIWSDKAEIYPMLKQLRDDCNKKLPKTT